MSQWERYLVKELPVTGGEIPQRQELNDLSDEQKFLYLEGLKRFQEVSNDDPLSYYQIAGIHGLPYTNWPYFKDPTTGKDFDTGITQVAEDGFCTHSSILFLSWHRPYLSLFESSLYKHVNDVADAIDENSGDKKLYQKLARNFRIPYWDWARRQVETFPKLALSPTAVEAFSTTFKPPTISKKPAEAILKNPLYKFNFQKGKTIDDLLTIDVPTGERDKNGRLVLDKWGYPVTAPQKYDSTQRYVVYKDKSTPDSVKQKFNDFFKDQPLAWKRKPGTDGPNDKGERYTIDTIPEGSRPKERNLSERTAYLLKAYKRYAPMSYNGRAKKKGDPPPDAGDVKKAEVWGSLEDIHNTVHNYAGGGGHMSSVPTSAFDPIFWLHHTNIDRLFAIWQALHESDAADTYVEERTVPGSTFAKGEMFKENKETPLWPFRKSIDGKTPWWNSIDAKRTEPFGYVYPETAGWQYPPTESARADLIAKIDNLYVNLPFSVKMSMQKKTNAGQEFLPQAALLKTLAAEKDNAKISAQEAEPMSQITLMQKIDAELPDNDTLVEQYSGEDKPYLRHLLDSDNSYREWLVNVKAEKHALGGQAIVHFFLGDPPPAELAKIWPYSPYHVGAFVPLGSNDRTACANCQQGQADKIEVTGQIPLTVALAERYVNGTIPNLSVDAVEDYLSKNLKWRVVLDNGAVIEDQSQLDGLLVYVVSNKVTVSADDKVPPIYDDNVDIHPKATTRPDDSDTARGNGTGLTMSALSAFIDWVRTAESEL